MRPFWSRADRDDYRDLGRWHGAVVDVVHVVVTEELLRRRLADRRASGSDDMLVSEELLASYVAGFEVPGDDEPDVVVVCSD